MNENYQVLSECYIQYIEEGQKAEIFKQGANVFDKMYGPGSYVQYRRARSMLDPNVVKSSVKSLGINPLSSKYAQRITKSSGIPRMSKMVTPNLSSLAKQVVKRVK